MWAGALSCRIRVILMLSIGGCWIPRTSCSRGYHKHLAAVDPPNTLQPWILRTPCSRRSPLHHTAVDFQHLAAVDPTNILQLWIPQTPCNRGSHEHLAAVHLLSTRVHVYSATTRNYVPVTNFWLNLSALKGHWLEHLLLETGKIGLFLFSFASPPSVLLILLRLTVQSMLRSSLYLFTTSCHAFCTSFPVQRFFKRHNVKPSCILTIKLTPVSNPLQPSCYHEIFPFIPSHDIPTHFTLSTSDAQN